LGTPEVCSGFFDSGNYHDMSRRVLRRRVAVFAPQLFRWGEQFGVKHDHAEIDRQLKQLGGSIAALEIWCLQRSLDALLTRPDVDPSRVGMIGLSYGGFHTLFAAATDTRIRVAVSSCFLNDRRLYAGHDWTWFSAANTFFDGEVAALVCPRPLYVEVGARDELFDVESARPVAGQVAGVYGALGIADRFRYKEHPGVHELDPEDDGIDFLIQHLAGA
jgi:dienelactone hydrolase